VRGWNKARHSYKDLIVWQKRGCSLETFIEQAEVKAQGEASSEWIARQVSHQKQGRDLND
jgi:hypothetical protein